MHYAEIGFGNESLVSTEIDERRTSRFLVRKIVQFYIRIWIKRTVIVIGLPFEFKITKKNRNAFKFLVGIVSI
jgi:hypothetical protein